MTRSTITTNNTLPRSQPPSQQTRQPDTIAAVLMQEIDFQPVPQRTRRLLRGCLERDPQKRLRDIGDFDTLLDDIAVSPVPRRSPYRIATAILAAAYGQHAARTGQSDDNWPERYAEYVMRDQPAPGWELSPGLRRCVAVRNAIIDVSSAVALVSRPRRPDDMTRHCRRLNA